MAFGLACTSAAHPGEIFRDVNQSLSIHFAAALNSHDIEYVLDFFAPDAVMITPDHPGGCGKAAIRCLLDRMFERKPMGVTLNQLSIAQFGDFAVEIGEYSMQVAEPGLGKHHERGKYVTGWRRQPRGEYLMTVTIWSRSS